MLFLSCYLIFLSSFVFAKKINAKSEQDFPNHLHATSACLLDASNGRVLFSKNAEQLLPMASTTKIMTCIVALEHAKLNEIVRISENAARQPDVQLNATSGQQFLLKDLLYSLMLESHNDIAVAIAEHVAGSVPEFAALMNAKAKELGALHTNFVTPNGLDAKDHQTTATDLAKIAAYAIQNKTFLKITNTKSHTFQEQKTGRSYTVQNKNRLLSIFPGAIGVKTGFTGKAGFCFVGAATRENKTFVSVVLACGWPPHKNYKWEDTKKLLEYGFQNYHWYELCDETKKFQKIPVKKGSRKTVQPFLEGSISVLLKKTEHVKVVYHLPKQLHAPVSFEQVIGCAKYYIDGTFYQELPILSAQKADLLTFWDYFYLILKQWSMPKKVF